MMPIYSLLTAHYQKFRKENCMREDQRIKTKKFLAWCECAKVSKQIGNYQLAIEYYGRALQIVPNNYKIWEEKKRLFSLLNNRILAENKPFQILQSRS